MLDENKVVGVGLRFGRHHLLPFSLPTYTNEVYCTAIILYGLAKTSNFNVV